MEQAIKLLGSKKSPVFLLLLLAGVLAACSTEQAVEPSGDSTDDVSTKDTDTKIQPGETIQEVIADVDVTEVTDTGPTDVMCALAGGFGCKCQQNSDCDSNFCIDSDQGKICTKTCEDSCPTDFKCIQKQSGAEVFFICVPAYPNLCKPCDVNGDCQINGANDNYCVPFFKGTSGEGQFKDGSFCMAACQPDGHGGDKCKEGYECQTLKLNVDGKPVKQCVPKSGECGCHDDWAQAGLKTECSKVNVLGTCKSQRKCGVDGNGATVLTACDAPTPATEVCGDNVDNDCNGKTDEDGAGGCISWYQDNDQDNYGSGKGSCQCANPGVGYSGNGGDCNDMNGQIHPGAVEICDNIDNNCNSETDESGSKGCTVFYKDLDGDGFGDPNNTACLCKSKQTTEWISQAGDCDDTPGPGGKIHPGVDETCEGGHYISKTDPVTNKPYDEWVGVDENCDGKTDDQGAIGCQLYYVDQDKDTFGVTQSGLCLCHPTKSNAAGAPGDCDDSAAAVSPAQPEICDGIDNDCDGKTDGKAADPSCGAIAAGTSKCLDNGTCGIGGCDKGKYDINGDPSDGCECQALGVSNGLGGFCGSAIDLGDLPDGSSTLQKGGQILPGEAGDWYRFNAKDQPDGVNGPGCDDYDVRISFVLNPGNLFVFDVFRGTCSASDQVCSAETQHDWSTAYYGPPPFGPGNKASANSIGTLTPSPFPEASGECQCVGSGWKNNQKVDCVVIDPLGDHHLVGCGPGGLPGMNVCKDNSAYYYVRVYVKPGSQLTCDQYIIKFDNSNPSPGSPPPNN